MCSACQSPVASPPTESELIAAVMAREERKLDSLLQAGAPANSLDEEGTPALILAVNAGKAGMVKQLVSAGADINARRAAYFQSTALMEVGVRNDPDLAAWLLDQGADLHLQDTLGDTPLNWACFYGHKDLVALYISRGADWSVSSKQGNALDIAMHRGHRDLVRFFIEKGAGEQLDTEVKSFIQAVTTGDLERVRKGIRENISPDQRNELGTPALVLAAEWGHKDILTYLLRKGADIHATNRVGETALARAARFGHAPLVNYLLSARADPNFTLPPFRIYPLTNAAQAGQASIIQELLASEADPNVQEGINGFTPLMIATAAGYPEAVKALLAGGASPYIKGFEGEGLYDMLRYSNDAQIAEIIREQLLN